MYRYIKSNFDIVSHSEGKKVAYAIEKILDWANYDNKHFFDGGETFYEGAGKDLCLPCVAYLCSKFPWAYDEFAKIANSELRGDAYIDSITQIATRMCKELLNEKLESFWTPSKSNPTSRYWLKFLKKPFHEPLYDYSCSWTTAITDAILNGSVSLESIKKVLMRILRGNVIRYNHNCLSLDETGWAIKDINFKDYKRLHSLTDYICENVEVQLKLRHFKNTKYAKYY